MSWLHYLLEANIYVAVFNLLYFILFDRETYYRLNRMYLLISCIIAFIIPLVQIGALKSFEEGGRTTAFIVSHTFTPLKPAATHFNVQDYILFAYLLGTFVMLIILAFKIFQLAKLSGMQKNRLNDKYKLIRIENSNTAFSFFNYVFIGTKVTGTDTIIRHELVHINQKHSFDIVFLELIKIVSWFNPFIYLLQRSLKTVHEYIADEKTAAFENDTLAYSSFLVNNAYGISGSSVTHSFFNYNLLKKRIIMLNQKRSGSLARLKYLLVIPVCAGLLCVSTLGFSKTYGWIDLAPQKRADSVKQIKEVQNQIRLKIKAEIDSARKIAQTQTRQLVTQVNMKYVKHAKMNTQTDTLSKSQTADLIKKLPGITVADNGDVILQGKRLTNVRINGKDISDVKTLMLKDSAKRSVSDDKQQRIPPPPPPVLRPASAFESLSKYVVKNTRYSASARKNNVKGSVIVKFSINDNKKIINASILKGIGGQCDDEALRVVKAFPGTVNTAPGDFKYVITFYIDHQELKKAASSDLFNDPSFAGEVIVTGSPLN